MEFYLGQIFIGGWNFPPRGSATCEGQILPIASNTALFSLLGTTFGGDGESTFALPDLRGRSIVGVGNGPGLDQISWGERGGSYMHTLTSNQMPSHTHAVSVNVNTEDGEENTSTGIISNHSNAFNEDPTTGQTLGGVNAANTGGSQAFGIRSPFLGLYVCIALTGIFPSRN